MGQFVQILVFYFNKLKLQALLPLVLLLVFTGIWLVKTNSGSAAFDAEPAVPQSLQDRQIELQPTPSTTVDHHEPGSEAPVTATYNDGQLMIMPRPDWALDGNLLVHFSQLEQAAKQGDSEAAYVLGMNLHNCYFAPEDDTHLAERLEQAYQFNDNGVAVAENAERYDFCLGVDKQQRNQFYAYLAMAADNGYVPAQEAIALITPEQYMHAAGYAKLERNDYVAKRSSFVQLLRIFEGVDPLAYLYSFTPQSSPDIDVNPLAVLALDTPAPAPAPAPPPRTGSANARSCCKVPARPPSARRHRGVACNISDRRSATNHPYS